MSRLALDLDFAPGSLEVFSRQGVGFRSQRPGRRQDCACAGPGGRRSWRFHEPRAMAETEARLLRQCPLLLPQNRAKTVYEGFISAQVLALVDALLLGELPSSGAAAPLEV